jgi:ribosomal protein L16/L10AE
MKNLTKTKELETARRAAQKVFTEEAGKEFKAYVDQSVAASKVGTGEIARVASLQ